MENSKHLEIIKKAIYHILQEEPYGTIMQSRLMSVIELFDISEDINKKQLQLAYTRGKNDVLQEIVNRSSITSPNSNPPKKEWDESQQHIRSLLKSNLADYYISVRLLNCLRDSNINTIGDLVKHRESELIKFRNLGELSLVRLRRIIEPLGLFFGMNVEKYKLNED